MIVIGYQGIGKSTLAGVNNCIDLESGNFWIDGKRADDWYKPYCQIAKHLSSQGFTVFVSSHKVVRDELANSIEDVIVIYPAPKLKCEWVEKLRRRYHITLLDKDFKAWKNAEDRYEDNIKELSDDGLRYNFIRYEIGSMVYNLKHIIASIKKNLEYRKRD